MAAISQDISGTVMAISSDDRVFFVRLGERISQLRKAQQITQAQLAQELNVAQQTLQGYEAGTRRIPVSALPVVARALSVAMEDLFVQGEQPSRKRGPVPKWQQQIEMISKLPKTQQRFVSQVLQGVLTQVGQAG
jgi:transcriptional regulator with XRE-family HTH domain